MKDLHHGADCSTCVYKSLIFNSLTDEELQAISEGKREVLYRRGEIIIMEGAAINDFHYLKSGLVKIFKKGELQRDQIISISKPGEFVTLLSIFSNSNYKYSISALEDSVVCAVNIDVFKHTLRQNDNFAMEVMHRLSLVYDDIIENTFTINKKNLRGRIAYILIFFSRSIYCNERFDLPISRKEMAELIEMTPENVIRILSEFNRDKIIAIDGKKIEILQPERLDKISQLG